MNSDDFPIKSSDSILKLIKVFVHLTKNRYNVNW